MLLSADDIAMIETASLAIELAYKDRRDLLLSGLPADLRASLPDMRSPRDQLVSDLHRLAAIARVDGLAEPPIAVWLANASRWAGSRPERTCFEDLRRRVIAPSTAPAPSGVPVTWSPALDAFLASHLQGERLRAVLTRLRWPLQPHLWRRAPQLARTIRVVSRLVAQRDRAALLDATEARFEVQRIEARVDLATPSLDAVPAIDSPVLHFTEVEAADALTAWLVAPRDEAAARPVRR